MVRAIITTNNGSPVNSENHFFYSIDAEANVNKPFLMEQNFVDLIQFLIQDIALIFKAGLQILEQLNHEVPIDLIFPRVIDSFTHVVNTILEPNDMAEVPNEVKV